MAAITKPMMGRGKKTGRGAKGADLAHDIAYDYRREIGRYMRELRTQAEMTQEDLGRHLGMGKSAISSLELGRSVVSPERYEKIADLFGKNKVDVGKFLLRYTNPWLYAMIYGSEAPNLRRDLASMSGGASRSMASDVVEDH